MWIECPVVGVWVGGPDGDTLIRGSIGDVGIRGPVVGIWDQGARRHLGPWSGCGRGPTEVLRPVKDGGIQSTWVLGWD